jgi:hypothetical protein
VPGPIGCYTNRFELPEIEKRRGFPGFDTVFDINGADGELGDNPDYFLADPDGTVNDMRALPSPTTQAYERVLRGLAFERDDPAYYAVGVKIDTGIIGAVDVSAIDPADFVGDPGALEDLAEEIVYGENDPDDPNYAELDCEEGFCKEIREAGKLYTLDPMLDWRFTFRGKTGALGGTGQTVLLAPWLPKNFFGSLATVSDRANPFRGRQTPTRIDRMAVDPAGDRVAGERYHILDVASGAFDATADCDTGACTYGPDPVDPRLLKFEQLVITAGADNVLIGGQNPAVKPDWFGPYPNNFFGDDFGGDFSGIVAKLNTFTTRPSPGLALKETPFTEQVAYSNTPGYISTSRDDSIPYTNIDVTGGLGELPMRPAPDRSNLSKLDPLVAQGIYLPSPGLVHALSTQDFDEHEFNIKQIDRAFNHGASQSDTYELKEAYLDMEFLDSRLWVRAGIQNIVWGKTELFRTTDQFNPQDMAMASLPGLEESRIGLLSGRAVYSFYDVGPLEDVRLELAANFDRNKPADLGACGEPYTIDVVCGAVFGLAVHGLVGIGLAGVDRPPSAWNDVKGVEFGGRVEFRWDRFSFAITDFYGYHDFPYPDPIFFYERNVDPNTGRPRKAGATGPCENAAGFTVRFVGYLPILHAGNAYQEFIKGDATAAPSGEGTPGNLIDDYARRPEAYTIAGIGIDEACLKGGGAPGGPNENRYDPDSAPVLARYLGAPDDPANPTAPFDRYSPSTLSNPDPDSFIYQTQNQWTLKGASTDFALAYHPANQQFFAALCSMTITIAISLTPGACGFNIFGSPTPLIPVEGGAAIRAAFSEFFSVLTAGEIDSQVMTLGWGLVQKNTKPSSFPHIPTNPMNRDVRDGMVTAGADWIVKGGTWTSPENFLTIDSTLTKEQKALLGCGPFYGTRCDSGGEAWLSGFWFFEEGGGIDVQNGEASAWLQAFPGSEGTDVLGSNSNLACYLPGTTTVVDCDDPLAVQQSYPRVIQVGDFVDPADPDNPQNSEREFVSVDTWVTWSDDIQPGTIGFEGMEYCTRYAPESPYANEMGIVRLPGCRGIKSVTINNDTGVPGFPYFVDVVFDRFYTPREDGCIISQTITTDRFGADRVYYIRAINEDGTPATQGEAGRINTELADTCFNTISVPVEQVSLRSTHRVPNDEAFRYIGATDWQLQSRTLWHPLAGCENAGLDLRGNEPFLGPDEGFVCDFRFRNFEADFIDGHAQVFRNEIANWSWNMLMFLMVTSCNSVSGGDDISDPDCFDPELAWDTTRCSISTPQFCRNVKSFLSIGATNRNHVLAGGNERFGRRDFIWHSGGEAVLRYARRNVFGFSMDFAEDVSKTNWGLEFTWFGDIPFMNNNSLGVITDSQTLNLTISVDRPTFINFLNANRTFFFNTQWFFQYLLDYDEGFTGTTGPFNVLFTFAFFTGYFQDRLLPQMVTVYDFRSQSGGFLPSIQYRFNERFSVTFGINFFIGRGQFIPMPLRSLAPVTNRAGANAYEDGAEFFISNIRHRDEAYLRIRWTF